MLCEWEGWLQPGLVTALWGQRLPATGAHHLLPAAEGTLACSVRAEPPKAGACFHSPLPQPLSLWSYGDFCICKTEGWFCSEN